MNGLGEDSPAILLIQPMSRDAGTWYGQPEGTRPHLTDFLDLSAEHHGTPGLYWTDRSPRPGLFDPEGRNWTSPYRHRSLISKQVLLADLQAGGFDAQLVNLRDGEHRSIPMSRDGWRSGHGSMCTPHPIRPHGSTRVSVCGSTFRGGRAGDHRSQLRRAGRDRQRSGPKRVERRRRKPMVISGCSHGWCRSWIQVAVRTQQSATPFTQRIEPSALKPSGQEMTNFRKGCANWRSGGTGRGFSWSPHQNPEALS